MGNLNNNIDSNSENAYFKDIFTFAGIGIITLNSKNNIEFVNKKVLNIFGYTSNELINKNISSLIHSTDHQSLSLYIQSNSSLSPSEFKGIHKDKTTKPVIIRAFP